MTGWLLVLAYWFVAGRVGGTVARQVHADLEDAVGAVMFGIIAGAFWPLYAIGHVLWRVWLGGRS